MDRNKNNVWLGIAGFIILAIGFQSEALASPSPTRPALSSKARLVEIYGKLPLSFEENRGQSDGSVKFASEKSRHAEPEFAERHERKATDLSILQIARLPRLRLRQSGLAVRLFARLSEQEDGTAARGDWT